MSPSVICYLPDTTTESNAALHSALGIATRRWLGGRCARVVAIHVTKLHFMPTDTVDMSGRYLVLQAAEDLRTAVESRVGEARRASGVPVVFVSDRGPVAATLTRHVNLWGGDVIVLPMAGGARSRFRLAARLRRATNAVVVNQPAHSRNMAVWASPADSS
ncbi:universal stress protein [Frankia sp. Cppng1_Ct_nod]|uniref:universal stress protein n=1 Tax=Frankia sp. Cppng1_Ct_nod TaxID=2897162 RepID=UPI001040F0FA|nr:universal stress protein [Frankia sp. Cppng1_Ct_nod]